MTMFMSTVTGKIDAKGRVSVPSVFRSAIISQNGESAGPHGIFVYPSFTEKAIEGGGQALMSDIGTMVDRLDPVCRRTRCACRIAICRQL